MVLAGITGWYVFLTGKMSKAAWASHEREITPNLVLQPPIPIEHQTSLQPRTAASSHFVLTNLSSGPVLIAEAEARGWVGKKEVAVPLGDARRRVLQSGEALPLQSLVAGEYGPPGTGPDAGANYLLAPFDQIEMIVKYWHGPNGRDLFTVHFKVFPLGEDRFEVRTLG